MKGLKFVLLPKLTYRCSQFISTFNNRVNNNGQSKHFCHCRSGEKSICAVWKLPS